MRRVEEPCMERYCYLLHKVVEDRNHRVPNAHLNPAVIPRVESSIDGDHPKNFQTPSTECLENQINAYLSTRSRNAKNPIEMLRQKEVFVEVPIMVCGFVR